MGIEIDRENYIEILPQVFFSLPVMLTLFAELISTSVWLLVSSRFQNDRLYIWSQDTVNIAHRQRLTGGNLTAQVAFAFSAKDYKLSFL